MAYVLRSELDTLQERRRHFRAETAADPLAAEALCLIVPGPRGLMATSLVKKTAKRYVSKRICIELYMYIQYVCLYNIYVYIIYSIYIYYICSYYVLTYLFPGFLLFHFGLVSLLNCFLSGVIPPGYWMLPVLEVVN